MMFNLIWKIIRLPHLNPSAEWVNAKSQYILHRKWPIACILCTHQKLYKFDEVVMIIFVSWKNRPLLLAKGVHWCLIFMCTLHLWPGTWDTSQRKFMIFHQLSQKLIYMDWLDFYVYVIYIQTYVDHFFILEIHFFVGKKLPNLEPHPPVGMLWIANYINLWLWLIDRWNVIFFYLPSAAVRRYFDPHDILTPGSEYRNDILTPPTIFWPPPLVIINKVLFAFNIYLIRYIIILPLYSWFVV